MSRFLLFCLFFVYSYGDGGRQSARPGRPTGGLIVSVLLFLLFVCLLEGVVPLVEFCILRLFLFFCFFLMEIEINKLLDQVAPLYFVSFLFAICLLAFGCYTVGGISISKLPPSCLPHRN